jgi:hypothetical protein
MAPGCTRTRRSTRISTTTRSLARSWPRPTRSTVARRALRRPARGRAAGRAGHGAGAARLVARGQAPTRGAARRRGGADPEGASRAAAGGKAPPGGGPRGALPGKRGLRGLSHARGDEGRRRFGKPRTPYKPSATPQGSTSPIPTRATSSQCVPWRRDHSTCHSEKHPWRDQPREAQARSAWIASTPRGEGADGGGEDTRSVVVDGLDERPMPAVEPLATDGLAGRDDDEPRMLGRRSGSSARGCHTGARRRAASARPARRAERARRRSRSRARRRAPSRRLRAALRRTRKASVLRREPGPRRCRQRAGR